LLIFASALKAPFPVRFGFAVFPECHSHPARLAVVLRSSYMRNMCKPPSDPGSSVPGNCAMKVESPMDDYDCCQMEKERGAKVSG